MSFKENREDDFKKLSKQNRLSFENMPKEHGFYLYKKDNITNVFISDPETLATPDGNPVVFTCDENNTKYCNVSLSVGKVYFGLDQINRYHVPIEEWPQFYKQFIGLVGSFIIKDESEIIVPQKSGENK